MWLIRRYLQCSMFNLNRNSWNTVSGCFYGIWNRLSVNNYPAVWDNWFNGNVFISFTRKSCCSNFLTFSVNVRNFAFLRVSRISNIYDHILSRNINVRFGNFSRTWRVTLNSRRIKFVPATCIPLAVRDCFCY